MKKIYISPTIEISAFIPSDILCTSTILFEGSNYDVVEDGVAVNDNGTQRVNSGLMSKNQYFN